MASISRTRSSKTVSKSVSPTKVSRKSVPVNEIEAFIKRHSKNTTRPTSREERASFRSGLRGLYTTV